MPAVEISKAAPPSATSLPSGGQSSSIATVQGLDLWLENFRKYEATLQEVTRTSAETKFKAELNTIEQWFKVLPEAERTATVYALMLHSNQDQIRFFVSVLQQMIRPEVPKLDSPAADNAVKAKDRRPPSLNLPLPGSPTTPTPDTMEQQGATEDLKSDTAPILEKSKETNDEENGVGGLPGLGVLSPFHLNMLANAGLSKEAQLLAVQLIMSGIVQPVGATTPISQRPAPGKKSSHPGDAKSWRTPASAKYPRSALQSSGLRTSALKSASLKSAGLASAGLASAGLDTPSGLATPREEDFDPELLNDIPAWLRSLRLHKYTASFDGLTWQEMVVLDDATLEAKGVATQGARRRLLRTFEHARKKMGMEQPDSATPTTSTVATNGSDAPSQSNGLQESGPRSAVPLSKLSITSPVFVPSSERGPQSAAPTVSISAPSPSA